MKQQERKGAEDAQIRKLEMRQEKNVAQHRALEKAEEELEQFFTWHEGWVQASSALLSADAHTRNRFESLVEGSSGFRAQTAALLDDALAENRKEQLRLSSRREEVLRAKEHIARGERGDERWL